VAQRYDQVSRREMNHLIMLAFCHHKIDPVGGCHWRISISIPTWAKYDLTILKQVHVPGGIGHYVSFKALDSHYQPEASWLLPGLSIFRPSDLVAILRRGIPILIVVCN